MNQYRTLMTLTLAQAFAQSAVPMVVLLGGIIGAELAPSEDLATLPVALMIVGTALTTVPASLIMARIGRKPAFITAALVTAGSGFVAAWSLIAQNFVVFCSACIVIGGHNAFIQQYRFAVAESVPENRVGPAISVLMLAGVVAAFAGPELAQRLHAAVSGTLFVGSFLALSALMVCAAAILSTLPSLGGPTESSGESDAGRPLRQISTQADFQLAVGAAVVGYSVMSLIMTATPVSMHRMDGFSLDDTAWVIQSHIVAMFLPSLFSGLLIARYGARRIIYVGIGLLLVCLFIAGIDRHLMHYWWALVLLGVGWNFLFVGGTALLTSTYRPEERFRVQALNDFSIFGLQAIAALGSGAILGILGWQWILWASVPWLLVLVIIAVREAMRATTPPGELT